MDYGRRGLSGRPVETVVGHPRPAFGQASCVLLDKEARGICDMSKAHSVVINWNGPVVVSLLTQRACPPQPLPEISGQAS